MLLLDVLNILEIDMPILCQLNSLRASMKQRHTKITLKLFDGRGECWLADVKLLSGSLNTAASRYFIELAIQFIHKLVVSLATRPLDCML